MGNKVVLLDTSILIDFFRSKDKSQTVFYRMVQAEMRFAVSSITRFEIYVGQKESQKEFWTVFYQNVEVLNFDDSCAVVAADIVKWLRLQNKMIDIPDIFIASTAIAHAMPVATLNKNHFERIPNLQII